MSTDLPPEAFTKKTLQDAFNWLQDQPEPVKASVHTPERLVSLYRSSQRRIPDLDAPVSSKKFIDDLKNLASSLDQFNQSPGARTPLVSSPKLSLEPEIERYQPPQVPPPPPEIASGTRISTHLETETRKASLEITKQQQHTTTETLHLDSTSRERVQQVRERFNLGTDHEALRLLISLGFEKFSQFQ